MALAFVSCNKSGLEPDDPVGDFRTVYDSKPYKLLNNPYPAKMDAFWGQFGVCTILGIVMSTDGNKWVYMDNVPDQLELLEFMVLGSPSYSWTVTSCRPYIISRFPRMAKRSSCLI